MNNIPVLRAGTKYIVCVAFYIKEINVSHHISLGIVFGGYANKLIMMMMMKLHNNSSNEFMMK